MSKKAFINELFEGKNGKIHVTQEILSMIFGNDFINLFIDTEIHREKLILFEEDGRFYFLKLFIIDESYREFMVCTYRDKTNTKTFYFMEVGERKLMMLKKQRDEQKRQSELIDQLLEHPHYRLHNILKG